MARGIIDLRRRTTRSTLDARLRAARAFRPEPAPNRNKLPLRARRRRLRAFALFAFVVLAAGAAQGLSWLSYLPQFSISTVSVAGTASVPARLVDAYVETKLYDGTYPLFSRTNMFLFPRAEIENDIAAFFPRIRSADIAREGFLAQAITVTVVERRPFARWCSSDDACYLMDDTGFIFAPASTSTPELAMTFRGGITATSTPIGASFVPQHLNGILELFRRLRDAGFAPTSATVEDDQDFSVAFTEGFTLRAAFGSDAAALARNLQLALSADPLRGKKDTLDYVDLRFGNRVYYKFKSGVRGSTGQ